MILLCFGTSLAAVAMLYSVVAWFAARRPPRPEGAAPGETPAVTILKPLCGAEFETYDCLRSFCLQEYPTFQIVFGVREVDDPAIAVVQRLQREFPELDLTLIIDRTQHGSNRKVSNLINMMALARHDCLVIADSDIRVERDYLGKVVAPMLDPGVGVVTCIYMSHPRRGFWSLLGSLFINEWFMPSVRVAAMTGSRAFAFGATIAIRRDVLVAVGGFKSIANQLADDYCLGERTRRLGLRTVLSEVQVETCVEERSIGDLVRRELRWLRTIRAVRPLGYAFSFVTFGVPVALLGCLLAAGSVSALFMLAITAVARVMLHVSLRRPQSGLWSLCLLPLRDLLNCLLWFGAFASHHVHWRGARYQLHHDGSAQSVWGGAAP